MMLALLLQAQTCLHRNQQRRLLLLAWALLAGQGPQRARPRGPQACWVQELQQGLLLQAAAVLLAALLQPCLHRANMMTQAEGSQLRPTQ